MAATMTAAPIDHIVLDPRGVAWIKDANTKVIEVALDASAWKLSPEAIQAQHPHLTMAQICAALAFYYDHQSEIDAQIQRDLDEVETLRAAAAGESPIEHRHRAAGRAP